MLVLSRRLHETILIPAVNAAVRVVAIKPGVVRLGIEAPPDVAVWREEVQERLAEWEVPQSPAPRQADSGAAARRLVHNRLRVADVGLDLLARQLQAGQVEDALATLATVREDLRMLEGRLEEGVSKPPPPAPRPALPRVPALV
jgi:carbon storage regulator